jgi:hypothetical protein
MTLDGIVVAVSACGVAACAVGVAWYGHVINREIRKIDRATERLREINREAPRFHAARRDFR